MFEQKLLKKLDQHQISNKTLLIATSGGRDSVVLLHLLHEVAKRRKNKLIVGHIHHGVGQNLEYRDAVCSFVESLANQLNLPFLTLRNLGNELKSESELRQFRRDALGKLALKSEANIIVLAHHAEDLLETRLLRLMRGVGAQGFGSMSMLKNRNFRPLLDVYSTDIVKYAAERNLNWMEDPTNRDNLVLRNWIRNIWLPLAEQKRKGAKLRMIKSFELLAEELNASRQENKTMTFDELGISRLHFTSLDRSEKRRVIASYMLSKGLINYGATHIEEVVKRLDTDKKKFSFTLLKRNWCIDTGHIRVEDSF